MSEVKSYFKNSGFYYDDSNPNKQQVKILTGQEEALYAWMASNYLENQFVKI